MEVEWEDFFFLEFERQQESYNYRPMHQCN